MTSQSAALHAPYACAPDKGKRKEAIQTPVGFRVTSAGGALRGAYGRPLPNLARGTESAPLARLRARHRAPIDIGTTSYLGRCTRISFRSSRVAVTIRRDSELIKLVDVA
jgi:hypothetical protein